MLESINSVKRVGLFEDLSPSPECDFGRMTLIYGENGVGKSTIAAILDSLREQNPSEILRRRALPGDNPPRAVITLDGRRYEFDGQEWNDQPPHDSLDIFFPGFISRNVHAATAVGAEHRRNLCEFALGREAVKKVNRLAEVDQEARAVLADRNQIEQQLRLLIKGSDTLETFLVLPKEPRVDELIEKARSELRESQARDVILARALPEPVPLPAVHPEEMLAVLQRRADGIGPEVSDVVQRHIQERLDSDGEAWLAYGAKHVSADEKCPFCAQDIAGLGLVQAIHSYFSREYRAYSEALFQELQGMMDRLGPTALSEIRVLIATQLGNAAQWSDQAPVEQRTVNAALHEAEAAWKRGASLLQHLVAKKLAHPLEKIDRSVVDEAVADYERAMGLLSEVNTILSASREAAQARKAVLARADSTQIESSLHRSENQKARYDPSVEDLVTRRALLSTKRQGLDGEREQLKDAITAEASRVTGKYQKGINHYLEYFGCDCRIESIKSTFPSGKASMQYKLKVRGREIDLGFSEREPCFETVLSEGDKNALALSFFLARLKDQQDLGGRVVVLDDPVNSLGSSRRRLVAAAIRDLYTRGAQVVVLTHDDLLAALMWRDSKLRGMVCLQMERTRKGTWLRTWDVERATRTEYVEAYLTLVEYLESGGDHSVAAGRIRPYLEQRIRHMYPGPPFSTRHSLGDILNIVRTSSPGSRVYPLRVKLPGLEEINQAALPSHHATDDAPGLRPLSPEEVRLFVEKALKVLELP